MADVAARFISGVQAGQAELAHQQALADNKLRSLLLKHEIDRMKIEDQLRTREIQMQNLKLLEGQPEADLPGETNLGTLPRQQTGGLQPGFMTGMPGEPDQPQPQMASVGAPAAQAEQPIKRISPVQIAGVPEMGISPVSIRPRSLEELVAQSILQKLNEPYNLPAGAARYVGGRKVAEREATPSRITLGVKAAQGDAGARAALEAAYPARGAASTDPDRAARLQYDEFLKVYNRQNVMPTQGQRDAAQYGIGAPVAMPQPPPTFEKWQEMTIPERQDVIRNPNNRINDAELMQRRQRRLGGQNQPAAAQGAPEDKTVTEGELQALTKLPKYSGKSLDEIRQIFTKGGYTIVP